MGFFSRRGKTSDKAAADELFAKGQWAQALTGYEQLADRDADNVKLLRRVADLRAKLGRKSEAVEAYRRVADLYATGGFLVQAIAIYKIVLRLDPTAEDLGAKLAELYAKRGITGVAVPVDAGDVVDGALPEIPLFSDLDAEAFQQVVAKLVSRGLEDRQVLFRQGDSGDSIFIVTSGAVRVSRGELFLAELGEGTFFGEGAFFSREARGADVAASGDCELLEIRRKDMEQLMERYPGVARALGEFYRQRVLDGVLAATPLFRDLGEGERQRVAGLFRLVEVAAGDAVICEGEADRSLYLVKSGRFEVATQPPGGGVSALLAKLGPGEFFGEVALVGDTVRTATVSALDDGELLRVSGEDLLPLLEEHPQLRQLLEQTRDQRAAATVATLLGRDC